MPEPKRTKVTNILLALLLSALAAGACDRERGNEVAVEALKLVDGRSLIQAAQGNPALLVIYDPDNAFSCYRALDMWSSWANRHDRFNVFLTEPPTHSHQVQFARHGISITGALPPHVSTRVEVPLAVIVDHGRVLYQERLHPSAAATPLLDAIYNEPTTSLTDFLESQATRRRNAP